MYKFHRYVLLAVLGAFLFVVISIFQHQMYNTELKTYLKNETLFQEGIYRALILKHDDLSFDIKHITEIQHKITNSKYFLFNPKLHNLSLNIVSQDILKKISERLKDKDSLSCPIKPDENWHVLTCFNSVIDPNIYIISLTTSDALHNMQINRIKRLFILLFILTVILILFNKTLLYAQNLKIEKDKISLALRESELYFNNAMIGFLIVDKDRNIVNVNPHFCKMFGYEKNELISMSAEILHISYEAYKQWGELLFSKAQKESLISVRYEMRKKDNTIFLVEVSGAPFDKSRELFDGGVVWTAKDITKQAQDEVYLEKKIKEAVAKNIKQAQIYEQEKLRDVKFNVIGQLSAGITHEINTPLTYVKGNLEMMRMDMDDIADSTLKEQLISNSLHLEDGLNRIAKIVDSMREMAQQTSEIKEAVNIYATLVTSLVLAHNRSKHISSIYLNSKEFSIEADKNEFNYQCMVQKQRIEQVWIVIINNALDELQKMETFNEREFYIDCHDNDESITISFRDNAGGIDNKILKDIFEPFVSTKTHGGMGVGLSIAKKILNEQNGTIKAYNDAKGAIFEITLPKHAF